MAITITVNVTSSVTVSSITISVTAVDSSKLLTSRAGVCGSTGKQLRSISEMSS